MRVALWLDRQDAVRRQPFRVRSRMTGQNDQGSSYKTSRSCVRIALGLDVAFVRGAASCSSGGVTRAPRCMQLPARLGCTCRRAFDAPFGVANPSKSAIAAKFRPRKTRIRHIQREYLHFYAAKHARRRTRRQYFQSCAACSQLLRVMPGAAACVRGAARC